VALAALQKFPVDANMVHVSIGLASKFCHDCAVHLHVPGRDQLLSFPPGSNASRRDDLLKPFEGHIYNCGNQALSGPR
jgi:hypothetical protein